MHIVVTGASSGIGRDIAKALDRADCRLSLVARRAELLDSLRSELRAQSRSIPADLSDPQSETSWLDKAEATFGPVDMLVNNAGVSYVEPLLGIDQERIRTLFQVNVMVPIAAVHRVLPGMLQRKSGVIVNIASNSAFNPAPYFAHYSATKGAIGNFSESLRMELKNTGVRVITVYPGPIKTPMGDRNWKQLKSSKAAETAPIGSTEVLAQKIVKAIDKDQARVIYPGFYALSWWLPSLGRGIASAFMPEATGEKTPPLPGDRK